MLPKKKETVIIISVLVMMLMFAYFIALHYTRVESLLNGEAYVIDQTEQAYLRGVSLKDPLSVLIGALLIAGTYPFRLNGAHPIMALMPTIGILGIMFFIGLGIDVKRRAHSSSAPGRESGSAEWMTEKGLKRFMKLYTTPYEE